jgi:shikimate kinase
MAKQKTLFMLIGPKGSGKTYIGTLVDQHTDIAFLRVEPIWLSLKPNENGWKKVEATIDAMFKNCNKVMIESLGAGDAFSKFYASLAEKYSIKMIRVYANLETCFTRVKTRSDVEHIAVSDEKVVEYNRIAAAVTYNWSLEINNDIPASDRDIINAIQSINHVEGE